MAAAPYIHFRGRRMTPVFRDAILAAEQRAGFQFIMTQGGWNAGGVAASAGTHDRDAADWSIRGMTRARVATMIEALRWAGIFASLRTSTALWGVRAQGFAAAHVHGVPNGWGLVSAGARRQAEAYRRGRDGLRGNGPDVGPGHTHAYRSRLTPMRPQVTVIPPLPKPAPAPNAPTAPRTDPVPRHTTPGPWMTIPVDGRLGAVTLSRLQWELRVQPTGALDHWTIRALKIWLGGLAADDGTGVLRVIDVQRLQARVGVTPDGKWGPVTTRALQTWLNRNNPNPA